ncbi:7.9 kDa [Spodoptera frugiperda ascovirus 1a]|uniref:7.9 kDa n=1 Tax=Spodoptera frugiperda ascovirus 1a TaxID=113370 RepID=Q0E539_SFAVA|nr:7.9 kDa [Spodoptera frugiperda ascovirus 1a]CAL44662.1 7.9 kDa [Spodoptera frugiperda ascovirus 1a]
MDGNIYYDFTFNVLIQLVVRVASVLVLDRLLGTTASLALHLFVLLLMLVLIPLLLNSLFAGSKRRSRDKN